MNVFLDEGPGFKIGAYHTEVYYQNMPSVKSASSTNSNNTISHREIEMVVNKFERKLQ